MKKRFKLRRRSNLRKIMIFCSIALLLFPNIIKAQDVNTIKPKSSLIIESSPWGVQFNPVAPHIDVPLEHVQSRNTFLIVDSLVNILSESGAKWVRFSVNWSSVQDDSGKFHWNYTDRVINGLFAKNIEIIFCLTGGHKTFTKSNSVRGNDEMKYWLEFVNETSLRYSNKVKYWEWWNEPNTIWFWKPAPMAREYFQLVKESTTVVRKNVPDAKILGGSVARLDYPFADTLSQLGIQKYIDIFTIHPYNEIPEAIFKSVKVPIKTPLLYFDADHSVEKLKELFKDTGVKVWQAECGYSSRANSLGWTGNGPWGDTIQAKWLLRRMMTDIVIGSDVSIFFTFLDFKENNPNKYNSKGLLKMETLERKVSYYTFRNMASTLTGKVDIDIKGDFQVEKTINEGLYPGFAISEIMGYYLTTNSSRCFAYWLPYRLQENTVPAQVNLRITEFKNPVLVDMVTGSIKTITSSLVDGFLDVKNIPLTDYPLFIVEAELLQSN